MKVKTLSRLWMPVVLAAVMLVAQGCPDGPDSEEERAKIAADRDYEAKSFLRSQYMEVYYYWRDEVKDRNAALKPYEYGSIYDFFKEMLYKDDRWSWMMDKDDFIEIETGVISGTWGVNIGQAVEEYRDYGLRVRYIFPGSPLERYGITRGAVLTRINGQNVEDDASGFDSQKVAIFKRDFYKSPQTFTFRLVNGRDTTFTAAWATSLSTRPGLITRVFQPGEFEGLSEPVGYFHYLSFKSSFLDDIHAAMKTFGDAGVRKLIVDLRYNGGGDSRASQLLIDYLAPESARGKSYVIRHHNSYLASLNDAYTDKENTQAIIDADRTTYVNGGGDGAYWDKVTANRIPFDEIYFITGNGTASASEMVINGLRPYMGDKLQMVGDTTYGKPNGMYYLMYPGSKADYDEYLKDDFTNLQWVFLPIAFFNWNSEKESIPLSGFVPDCYVADDLYHDFGVEETAIKACLSHIVSGRYLPNASSYQDIPVKSADRPGYRIDMEEDKPHYGVYKAELPFFEGK